MTSSDALPRTNADDIADRALAKAILDEAHRSTERLGDYYVYIAAILRQFADRVHPRWGLDWLRRRMFELHQLGLIVLARADLVINPELEAESEIAVNMGWGRPETFHFVRLPFVRVAA